MYTIYKYPFEINDEFTLEMPASAQILSVQIQRNQPVLWALVNMDKPKQLRKFRIYGTGHPIRQDRMSIVYIGTFQLYQGDLIFHLFDGGLK